VNSGQAVRIRPFSVADQQAVLEIWLEASKVGHPFLAPDDLTRQQALVAEVYLPNSETWVAEIEGRIVGFIGLLESFIGGLFVAPDAHGKGIGRHLIVHAHHLKGPLTVEVYADNPIAPSFYRRCGFIEIGRKEHDDEGRPLPLLIMQKS
jgi:putative acetyltransferase